MGSVLRGLPEEVRMTQIPADSPDASSLIEEAAGADVRIANDSVRTPDHAHLLLDKTHDGS